MTVFQDDRSGLRRRSPNPNSPHLDAPNPDTPVPYSPGLLSPYAYRDDQGFASARSPASVYTPFVGNATAPTIRLVPARSQDTHCPIPPSPNIARSQSDDHDQRGGHRGETASKLKRHTTDPSYVIMRRGLPNESVLYSRPNVDKPVPPLPPVSPPQRQESVRSISRSDLDSVDGASAGTGRRTWSSLLINPFKAAGAAYVHISRNGSSSSSRASSSNGLKPLQLVATPMSRKSSSMSSSVTLADSDKGAMRLIKSQSHSSASSTSTAIDSKILERVRSAGGAKITAKFPERTEVEDEEWTAFKMVLLLSVLTLFGYGLAALCWVLQTMLRISQNSDITMVSDPDVVTFMLLFSLLALFTSFVGLTGTLLSSRPILAFYNLLLWPTFISLALVGYTSFKRGNLQLDRKLNQVWSQFLTQEDRLRIQNGLGCCGYYNPFHDATYSKKCYPRTPLPGCKAKWTEYEQQALHDFATAAFSTVPIHIVNIVIALVCSNHVDRQFGRGLTPIKYRLQAADVRANALAILSGLSLDSEPKRVHPPSPALSSVMTTPPLHVHSRTQSLDSRRSVPLGGPVDGWHETSSRTGNSLTRVRTGEFGLPRPPHSRFSSLSFGRYETEVHRDSTLQNDERRGPAR